MKDIRFNSSPTQAPNQEGEEIEIIVPKIRVKKKIKCERGKTIKKRKGWTFIYGVWAH